jgi:UDP-N-acetylglucosamine 2-epimerase
LLCLSPYGIANEEEDWTYNTDFHNRAWKLFYTNSLELKAAQRLAINRGRNVVVTGYTNMTEYLSPDTVDVWNIKQPEVKRLIWAPHYSINADEDELYLSNFLWMAEGMVEIAKQYRDQLQIAFKPHPKLRTRLYQHPDWGQERTDKYYLLWDEMPNTQLETGLFIDLFKTSDAMVHDCDSFQVEYLYVNKPVMFVKQSIEQQNTTELCKRAIDCHYIGRNMDDVRRFVEMALRGEDTMREQRQQFFNNYLLPKSGTDVPLNIYNDIVTTLKL